MTFSHADLVKAIHYDPETGLFSRARRSDTHPVGGIDSHGYWRIGVLGKRICAHRLAWFYTHQKWPSDEIDHIDGNPLNNAISNLREATRPQNIANNRTRRDCQHGYKGVSFHSKNKKWAARISVGKRRFSLGYFHTPEEAHAAYIDAAKANYGEFARVSM